MDKIKTTADEDILNKIGAFGRFQKFSFFMLTWVNVSIAFNTIGYVFWAARPDHWCEVEQPQQLHNLSADAWKQFTIPYSEEEGYSNCENYVPDNHSGIAVEDVKGQVVHLCS